MILWQTNTEKYATLVQVILYRMQNNMVMMRKSSLAFSLTTITGKQEYEMLY
jgi:hypothetical protein